MSAPTLLAADVLLIDGRSGAGKTVLAQAIAEQIERVRGIRPQLIGMDELYPGWDGLAQGSHALPEVIRSAEYRRYDWEQSTFAPELHTIDPTRPLIVEGCGALTRQSRAAARALGRVYTVWIEAPAAVRKRRALARDGAMFAPHWQRWAVQEDAHFAAARPLALAREVRHAVA